MIPVANLAQIILAADPLYDDDHPELLSSAICENLAEDKSSRAIVMVPQRDLTTKKLVDSFVLTMASLGMAVLEEHTLVGQDDWDEDDDDSAIDCWCAIFGRQ